MILLLLDTVFLGWLGAQLPTSATAMMGQAATAYYFVFFLVILPVLSRFEKACPVPDSIAAAADAKYAENKPVGTAG